MLLKVGMEYAGEGIIKQGLPENKHCGKPEKELSGNMKYK